MQEKSSRYIHCLCNCCENNYQIDNFLLIHQHRSEACQHIQKVKKSIHESPEISTIYHAVNVNIYLECHLPHKYGCENVIGHGEEKPLLQKEEEEGEKKRAKLWKE